MVARRLGAVVALVALLSVPLVAGAQDQGGVYGRRSGFMMSARVLTPWLPLVAPGVESLLQGVALPRFLMGAQIGDLGVAGGVNLIANESATLFLLGPTVTYVIARGPGGRTQLHLMGSFTLGTGKGTDEGPPDEDLMAVGFDFGVVGRGLIIDNLGIDVGIALDYLSISRSLDGPGDLELDDDAQSVQIVGFLGGTFIL